MKDSLETKLGIFFAVAIVALFVVLESLGGFGFLKRGRHVTAAFKTVQELKVGDPVKMAGVPVGKVASIKLSTNAVIVLLDINREAEIRTDTKAAIRFAGLMGQNYVNLDFGSPNAPLAVEGAPLITIEQPDLNAVMTKLDSVAGNVENLTKNFSGDKIDNMMAVVTDVLQENRTNLAETVKNFRTISGNIADGKGTVGKLINESNLYVTASLAVSNFQNTAAELQSAAASARELLTNANKVVVRINEGQGTIGKLVQDDKLYTETTESMTNLKEILQKVNKGQGTVGKLINDDSMLNNVKLSLQKLDKATESLEDTGPLSIIGSMATTLF
jgi:phospholipid/cholesterol/gamma-HCH transport system substrate-binding protein